MKAVGVIRIECSKGVSIPGSILAEQEDGKFHGDFHPAPTKEGGFLFEIPFTDHNIAVAESYWKNRGWKVSTELFPLVDPFTEKNYSAWMEEEKKKIDTETKLLVKLEKEREKLVKAMPGLESTFDEQFQAHSALRGLAMERRLPEPERSAEFIAADNAVTEARNRIRQIDNETTALKLGLFL